MQCSEERHANFDLSSRRWYVYIKKQVFNTYHSYVETTSVNDGWGRQIALNANFEIMLILKNFPPVNNEVQLTDKRITGRLYTGQQAINLVLLFATRSVDLDGRW